MWRKWKKLRKNFGRNFQISFISFAQIIQISKRTWAMKSSVLSRYFVVNPHSVMPFKFVITSAKIWCFAINPIEQSLTCFQLIRQLIQFYGCHFTKRSLNRTTICCFREAKWKACSVPTLELNEEKSAMTNWQLNDRRKKQKKKQINENQFIKIAIIIAHCP